MLIVNANNAFYALAIIQIQANVLISKIINDREVFLISHTENL